MYIVIICGITNTIMLRVDIRVAEGVSFVLHMIFVINFVSEHENIKTFDSFHVLYPLILSISGEFKRKY